MACTRNHAGHHAPSRCKVHAVRGGEQPAKNEEVWTFSHHRQAVYIVHDHTPRQRLMNKSRQFGRYSKGSLARHGNCTCVRDADGAHTRSTRKGAARATAGCGCFRCRLGALGHFDGAAVFGRGMEGASCRTPASIGAKRVV